MHEDGPKWVRNFTPWNSELGLKEPTRRLSTMREAAIALAEHGITFEQIRQWVYKGVAGTKLSTYRTPGRADATLVDLGEVLGFHRRLREGRLRGPCQKRTKRITLNIPDDRGQAFHDLAQAYARRLGIPSVTVMDAVWMAVQQELRRVGGPSG